MPRLKKPKKTKQLEPYWQTTDGDTVKLYQGDVIEVLDKLPPRSVQMVVTSPPYWGLRDYGTATWVGGSKSCDHKHPGETNSNRWKSMTSHGGRGDHRESELADGGRAVYYKTVCKKCGAKRIDDQIGSERTPEEFVEKMVQVFRSVRRVLRDDGLVFLNLGDTYHNGSNLAGVPWRVALALQADGWVLRQDIIWAKPSPMPESVRNRCTKAHEYVFMLSKGQDYFYDCEAVREKGSLSSGGYQTRWRNGLPMRSVGSKSRGSIEHGQALDDVVRFTNTSNKRSVWTIASESYAGSHFAVFPTKLVEPCILAGTSAYGACAQCGTPWERVVDRNRIATRPGKNSKYHTDEGKGAYSNPERFCTNANTVGWAQRCDCATGEVVPCVVLDPFVGSGTTCCVAIEHGRRSVGIDLSAKYLTENAIPRITGYLVDVPAKANLVAIRTDNGKGPAKRFRKGRQL